MRIKTSRKDYTIDKNNRKISKKTSKERIFILKAGINYEKAKSESTT